VACKRISALPPAQNARAQLNFPKYPCVNTLLFSITNEYLIKKVIQYELFQLNYLLLNHYLCCWITLMTFASDQSVLGNHRNPRKNRTKLQIGCEYTNQYVWKISSVVLFERELTHAEVFWKIQLGASVLCMGKSRNLGKEEKET